jgi:magnesium-protoporphyrin O-methyltransferase
LHVNLFQRGEVEQPVPSGPLQQRLAGLRRQGVQDATLLDVGGGVGVIAQELLASGAASVVEVEASAEYAAAAREEAARRGTSDRIDLLEGFRLERFRA